MNKLLIFVISLIIIIASFITLGPLTSQATGKPVYTPSVRAAAIDGLVHVDGQPVVVTIWVAVNPGEDPVGKARAALRRAYPDAQELLEHSDYALTGLLWDQFKDGDPGNDQVVVNYNPQGVPINYSSADYRNTWLTAMATWTDVPTSNFVYSGNSVDTTRCPSLVRECPGRQYFDANNDVGWLNITDPSVLGVTWYSTSRDEFDMALDNQDFNWYVGDSDAIGGNQIDTQTVWLHELGHGLGLGHSDVSGAVMEPYYAGVRRVLHQDDLDGVSYLYPTDNQPVPTATPTPTLTSTPTPTPGTGNPTPTPCWPPGKCKK